MAYTPAPSKKKLTGNYVNPVAPTPVATPNQRGQAAAGTKSTLGGNADASGTGALSGLTNPDYVNKVNRASANMKKFGTDVANTASNALPTADTAKNAATAGVNAITQIGQSVINDATSVINPTEEQRVARLARQGLTPESVPTFSNIVGTYKKKGAIGVLGGGAKDIGTMLGQAGTQALGIVNPILFGSEAETPELAPVTPTPPATPGTAAVTPATEPGVEPTTVNGVGVTTTPTTFRSSVTAGPSGRVGESVPGTQVNITDSQGGKGTISFAGNRLGGGDGVGMTTPSGRQIDLKGLSSRIAHDSSPEAKANFAKQAALTEGRYAEARAMDKERELAGLENAYLRASASGQSELSGRLGDLYKQKLTASTAEGTQNVAEGAKMADIAFKRREAAGKENISVGNLEAAQSKNFLDYKQSAESTGTYTPSAGVGAFKATYKRPLTHNDLSLVLPTEAMTEITQSNYDPSVITRVMGDSGIGKDDIMSVTQGLNQQ